VSLSYAYVGEFDIDKGTEFIGEVGDVILWHNFLVRTHTHALACRTV
jgi:hypothetical protein